jgi:hypothetical protein
MNNRRFTFILFAASILFTTICRADECTSEVFIEKGICPGEYCRYGQHFVSQEDRDTYDKPNGVITGILEKGAKVQSITGAVYSIPLQVQRVPRRGRIFKDGKWVPAPELDLFADEKLDIAYGESFFVIRYEAEGYWKACHNGEIISVPEIWDVENLKPKNTWWVQLKNVKGKKFWVKAEPYQQFRRVFRCVGADCNKW